jgi:intracellular sulfur oxidation DsrE/DsrF family protein
MSYEFLLFSEKMKIVLSVDSEEEIPMSITAASHLSEMLETEEVEVVYLNGGIAAVTQRNRIAPLLKNEKVKVVACGTSMEARNITSAGSNLRASVFKGDNKEDTRGIYLSSIIIQREEK